MAPATKRPRHIVAFSNIRVLPSGYQVAVTRAKIEFSRHFAGHSEQSLAAALRFRDKVLRQLPPKRLHPVPRTVLEALGLEAEVPGVFRKPKTSGYEVMYRKKGRITSRTFSWRKDATEAEAYAAAIAFRESTIGARR